MMPLSQVDLQYRNIPSVRGPSVFDITKVRCFFKSVYKIELPRHLRKEFGTEACGDSEVLQRYLVHNLSEHIR